METTSEIRNRIIELINQMVDSRKLSLIYEILIRL